VVIGCNSNKTILVFVIRVNVASLTSIIVKIIIVISLGFYKIGFYKLKFCESGYKAICRVRGRIS
jgi:hypothetical protein